jgi:hypothetical protein
MKTNVITLLSASSMTGTSTVTSSPIPIDQLWGFAIQAVWTGTPTGTLKLQASCDPITPANASGSTPVVTNWTDVADSSSSIAGAAGSYLWNVSSASYNFVRLVYTNASSTGSLSAKATLKGV